MHGIIEYLPRFPRIAAIFGKPFTAWNAVLRCVAAALPASIWRSTPQRHPYPLTYEQKAQEKKSSSIPLIKAPSVILHPDDGTRWMVRVPIEHAVHNVWAKLQSEVVSKDLRRACHLNDS